MGWQRATVSGNYTRFYQVGSWATITRIPHSGMYSWSCWSALDVREHGMADTLAGAKLAANAVAGTTYERFPYERTGCQEVDLYRSRVAAGTDHHRRTTSRG